MHGYHGHKNWNHWNVTLWIWNYEGIYRTAKYLRASMDADTAARTLLIDLREKSPTTPDGAPWSLSAVRAALVGLS